MGVALLLYDAYSSRSDGGWGRVASSVGCFGKVARLARNGGVRHGLKRNRGALGEASRTWRLRTVLGKGNVLPSLGIEDDDGKDGNDRWNDNDGGNTIPSRMLRVYLPPRGENLLFVVQWEKRLRSWEQLRLPGDTQSICPLGKVP